ncbi:MAG: cytochrome c3 family protein [Candidatus Eisenbacteria bacterium]
MQLPPGQILRVTPTGDAYDAASAPTHLSLCLNCHAVSQTSFAAQAWQESLHSRAGVTCGACHGTHEAAFVTKPGPETCRTCHPSQYQGATASAHGPERAPGMGCTSCHEIHATSRRLASRVETCTGLSSDS